MLTGEEFRLFSNLIYEESGIYLKETRKDFLENRLIKRMSATGMTSPYWYYRFVTEKSKKELLVLLDLLTINETSFFRNMPQIDLLKNIILTELLVKKGHNGKKRLRIWSAGCSTGEEPYTIAMVVCETIPYHWLWDIKIFASDLSLTAIETAVKGEYSVDKVHTTVEDYYINKYFEKVIPLTTSLDKWGEEGRAGKPGNDKQCEMGIFRTNGKLYRVKDEIKKMIVFDFHNLKNDNGISTLDVIFCRNVMIYFDEEEQKRLIHKFYRTLNPGGYLFLGHAESLHGWDTGFQFVYHNKGTAYKKPEKI